MHSQQLDHTYKYALLLWTKLAILLQQNMKYASEITRLTSEDASSSKRSFGTHAACIWSPRSYRIWLFLRTAMIQDRKRQHANVIWYNAAVSSTQIGWLWQMTIILSQHQAINEALGFCETNWASTGSARLLLRSEWICRPDIGHYSRKTGHIARSKSLVFSYRSYTERKTHMVLKEP